MYADTMTSCHILGQNALSQSNCKIIWLATSLEYHFDILHTDVDIWESRET